MVELYHYLVVVESGTRKLHSPRWPIVTDNPELEDDSERLARVLGNVLLLSVNESLVAAQMEALSIYNPMPAMLDLKKGSTLRAELRRLSTALGGPPTIIMTNEGETPPEFDTYADAAITEAVYGFTLARSSVTRTHIYMIGSTLIKEHPELINNLPSDPEIRRIMVDQVEGYFWEHAETSYVRLASFWDRVGQLLDFAFFNIRQYERDGFAVVMDRISANFIRMNSNEASPAWSRLRGFQTSEKPDGLQWLLRRRNLLIHSLHLRRLRSHGTENPIFTSAYNHLDEAVRNKLRQGTVEEELLVLHQHLSAAATLFPDAVALALTESPVADQF